MILGLTKYNKQVFSQYGEDGMIQEALESVGVTTGGFFVDVGSWDGIYLSNVYRLLTTSNFSGICIEASSEKFKELETNMKDFNVSCLNSKVSLDLENSLNTLLKNSNCPKDFDLLSIDIDGNDFWIWKSLVDFRPKVVIIEYNSNHNGAFVMPYASDYVHLNNIDYYGATPTALNKLAEHLGYCLAGINQVNVVFIRKDINVLPVLDLSKYPWYAPWANTCDKKMQEVIDITSL